MAEILLVDGDADLVARNVAALRSNGHFVRHAGGSAEARSLIGHTEPDAVVLEAMLDGGLGGFDLARELAVSHPELPLLMLTRVDEYLDDQTRADQDQDGWLRVRRFMEKPVAPAVLAYEVDHLLSGL